MRPSILFVTSAGCSVALAAFTTFSPNGLSHWQRLHEENESLAAQVAAARLGNARILSEVEALRGDGPGGKAALEDAVRREIGWIRPGEVVVVGLDKRSKSPNPSAKQPDAAPKPRE